MRRSFKRYPAIRHPGDVHVHCSVCAPIANQDLPFQPLQEPACKTDAELVRRPARHNAESWAQKYRYKASRVKAGCRGRKVLGAREPQARPITGYPCWPRPTRPTEFFCPHHGRKEAFSLASQSVSSSLDRSRQGSARTHARSSVVNFSPAGLAAPSAELATIYFHARPGPSYCKSTGNSRVMNPTHAQFRHAPLSMHPSLSSQSLGKATVSNPGPAAAGPSMMTGLTTQGTTTLANRSRLQGGGSSSTPLPHVMAHFSLPPDLPSLASLAS